MNKDLLRVLHLVERMGSTMNRIFSSTIILLESYVLTSTEVLCVEILTITADFCGQEQS